MTRVPFLLVLLVLGLCVPSCTPRQEPGAATPTAAPVVTAPESPEAQVIYNYLAFQAHLQDQDPDQAVLSLENLIKLAPTPELYLELGNIYWRASRFLDAHNILKHGLDHYPESQLLLTTLAKTYAAQGRFDDAIITLDDFYKKHPDLVELVHEAATYRMEQQNFGDAADRLQAIPDSQATTATKFLLGKAFFGLGLHDQALAQYEKVLQTDPEYLDAWVETALTQEVLKNYVAAEQIYADLVNAGVDNPHLIFRLVDLNLKLNNPDAALSYALQAQDDLPLVLEAANLFLSQSFFDHAAQLLDPVADTEPLNPDALLFLAILEYDGRDNIDQARTYLEAIPANHPHHERALIFRIHLLFQDGQKYAAQELCTSGMDQYPDQVEFPLLLAEIHERDTQYSRSLEILEQAQKTWPNNSRVIYRLAVVHDRMDNKAQALVLMEQTITTDPEHAAALNYLGYTLADQGRDLERAQILIENAVRLEPDNGYFIDSLAWVYFKQKKVRAAWQEIKRAIRFATDDPVIWEHYGDIARAMHYLNEARQGYARALELEGENQTAVRIKLEAVRRIP